jgi:branched-chain amino acid transport system permease protein
VNRNATVLAARTWPVASLLVVVSVATGLAWLGDSSIHRIAVAGLIDLVLVVALYVFVGNSGVFSFGQMAFVAIGAYTAGILTISAQDKEVLLSQLYPFLAGAHTNSVFATIIAGAVAAFVGAVTSIPVMRLTGIAAALATFAVLVIAHVVAGNWSQVTNGALGLGAIPTTTTVDKALIWAYVTIIAAYLFQQSRVGLRLRGSREDEPAAQAAGVSIYFERRVAWIISAFFSGVGGALFAQYIGAFNPDTFYLSFAFLILSMLVIGGMKSLSGAVIGAVVIAVVSELLRRVEGGVNLGLFSIPQRSGLREVGLALIMLAILGLRPAGLTGGREIIWPFGRRERTAETAPTSTGSTEAT